MGVTESTSLFTALLAVQADAPALQRDKINPHFQSSYLSLQALMAEVLPLLNKHGIVLLQLSGFREIGDVLEPTLTTQLIHAESGKTMAQTMLLRAVKHDPQAQGSAITYARRYQLMAMLGLVADDDDDGNAAAANKPIRQPKPTAPREGRTERDGAISDTQRTRLFTIAGAHGVGEVELRGLVQRIAGVQSTKNIPKTKYNALVREIEERGKAAA